MPNRRLSQSLAMERRWRWKTSLHDHSVPFPCLAVTNGAIDVEKEIGSKKFYHKYKTVEGALESFKATRMEHIKYMKGTTEDLRNHVVQTTFGSLDCYQVCLVISLLDNKYLQQIEEIKADPNFPRR